APDCGSGGRRFEAGPRYQGRSQKAAGRRSVTLAFSLLLSAFCFLPSALTDTVQPRLSRGLRDLLPDQMLARQEMVDSIRRVYELYGFVPLSTPAIEYLDVLSGSAGQETQQSIFLVTNPEREELGLRFDLTVPLARVIAQYADLPRPFRRYQVS